MADKGKKEKGAPAAPPSKSGAKAQKAAPAAPPSQTKSAGAASKPAAVPPPAASQPSLDAATELKASRPHGFRRKLVGRITSDRMNKTVTVEVTRNALDPVYKKIIRVRERYKAHDETNQYKIGDHVEITEHRPISRNKRWMVTKLVRKHVEE